MTSYSDSCSPFSDASRISLKEIQPLAAGLDRWVFSHPNDPALIIKVHRLDRLDGQPWHKRLRNSLQRLGHWNRHMHEIQEFIAINQHCGGTPSWLKKLHGFIETDLGLGLVYEAERLPDGSLAPTLEFLVRENLVNEQLIRALKVFWNQLLESSLIVGDLNLGNLVYANDRIALIDGIGDHHAIPLRSWFPALNRRSKIKQWRRMTTHLPALAAL